ncbi:MAG: TatD family hydrolase [Clostridia bacterium]|nr:TatD family hydrolase [Clostridia bacterium]
MRLFDTHAHLTDSRFDEDRDTLIPLIKAGGVERIVDVACDTDELAGTLALAEKYDFIYAAAGIHPHYAADATAEKFTQIEAAFQTNKKLVAVGEIGLDYHYDFAPRRTQCEWFSLQLDFAKRVNKPVILHIREAFGDCMDILRENRQGLKGVMHCFSGSKEIALECVNMGLYIAFGGSVTFNNAKNLAQAAKVVPLDRLVIETDCPYMTPVPHRGKRNDPSYMIHTAQKLAEIKGITVEEVTEQTYLNALKLFEMN